ncbi:MAG: tetratricopeptide repeat protein [Saprospiraceae bacterium]|nr:tetratricopeptide repeat protein [Saprospiraceae bacterium]
MSKKRKSGAHVAGQINKNDQTATEKWLPVAIAGLAFLLFASGLQNSMLAMDDHSATVNNPAVTDFKLFGQYNLGMFAPLTWLGYSIAYTIGEESSFWFHLLSAIVHAVNVWLVYKLFRQLGSDMTVAGLVALFFGVHPIQVESVAWIAGFSTPLFSMFSLLSMRFYLKHTQNERLGNNYWFALALFLAACLSKSAAVTLPLVLIVLDIWMKRPMNRSVLLEKAPFFLLSLGFGALTLLSRQHAGHLDQPADFSLLDRGLMACQTVLFYWKKILIPTGLSIWYPFEKTDGAWHWSYYAAPAILALIMFLAWKSRKALPLLWVGVLFYLANIVLSLPWSTFGTFELRSDRYNYLAVLGVFAFLTVLPGYFKEHKPSWVSPTWGLLGIMAGIWLVASGLRIRDWKSTTTLIESAMASTGDNFGKAYLWRGIIRADEKKYNDAIQDFGKALAENPLLMEAYKQRGNLMGPMKNFEQAIADLTKYLEANPESAPEYYNRGLSYVNLEKHAEALADFNKCIELDPKFKRAYRARGNTYLKLGDQEKGNADLKTFEGMPD